MNVLETGVPHFGYFGPSTLLVSDLQHVDYLVPALGLVVDDLRLQAHHLVNYNLNINHKPTQSSLSALPSHKQYLLTTIFQLSSSIFFERFGVGAVGLIFTYKLLTSPYLFYWWLTKPFLHWVIKTLSTFKSILCISLSSSDKAKSQPQALPIDSPSSKVSLNLLSRFSKVRWEQVPNRG